MVLATAKGAPSRVRQKVEGRRRKGHQRRPGTPPPVRRPAPPTGAMVGEVFATKEQKRLRRRGWIDLQPADRIDRVRIRLGRCAHWHLRTIDRRLRSIGLAALDDLGLARSWCQRRRHACYLHPAVEYELTRRPARGRTPRRRRQVAPCGPAYRRRRVMKRVAATRRLQRRHRPRTPSLLEFPDRQCFRPHSRGETREMAKEPDGHKH